MTTTVHDLTAAGILTELHRPGEHTSLCTLLPGDRFRAAVIESHQAPAQLPQDRNVWFGVNPVRPDAAGRGTAEDVTRWAALYADLDVKPGSLPDLDAARSVVDTLAAMLGTAPAYLIASGHGLQPVWQVDPDDPAADTTDLDRRAEARALSRRWGRLVARVAADYGAQDVDSVFDLARVLRAPGTINHKADPVPATATTTGGHPLTVADVAEALDAYGVTELPEDRETLGAVVSPPADWQHGEATCRYVARMVDAWATDTAPRGRHPWLLSQATRLAAAHRAGCITAEDHQAAWHALAARFRWLLTNTAPARDETPREVQDAAAWGTARAATFTSDKLARELGDHRHSDPLDLDGLTGLGEIPSAVDAAVSPQPAEGADPAPTLASRMVDGGAFILDTPAEVPAVWGNNGGEVLWSQGESCILAGPPGVGKTTLTGQVVRALIGLDSHVLGYPVATATGRVLYLAMDRPRQIARALARHFTPAERDTLDDKLRIWPGPPPADVAKNPGILAALAAEAGASHVILDSLKDAALGLSEDEVGAGYNRARQIAIAAGVELLELHHVVKRGANGAKPRQLEDLYGSVWISSGAGSVILLWGAAGDPIVELSHLKQPAEPVGPLRVIHDHGAGRSDVWHSTDPLTVVRLAGNAGVTAQRLACAIFETDKPTPSETEKARRRLDKLVRDGLAETFEVSDPRGGPARTAYREHSREHSRQHLSTTALTEPESTHAHGITAGQTLTEARTARTRPSTHVPPHPSKGAGTRAPLAEKNNNPCPECGDPTDGPPLMRKCAARHTERTTA